MPHLIDAATKQRALDLLDAGMAVKAVAEEMGVAAVTLYRWKQEADQKPPEEDDVPAPIPPTIVQAYQDAVEKGHQDPNDATARAQFIAQWNAQHGEAAP